MPILFDYENPLESDSQSVNLVGSEIPALMRTYAKVSSEDLARIHFFNANSRLAYTGANHFKCYDSFEQKRLGPLPQSHLAKLQQRRRTQRDFNSTPLTFQDVSELLQLTLRPTERSIQDPYQLNPKSSTKMSAPSAGSRNETEVYIYVRKTSEMDPGLYYYHPLNNSLFILRKGHLDKELLAIRLDKESILMKSGAIVFLTAIPVRTVEKYGLLGWKYVYLNAGHIGQNLVLATTEKNLGCVPLGGGQDKAIADFLDIDIRQEIPIYSFAIGRVGARAHD